MSKSGEQWALVPKGESDDGCRIAIDIAGGGATVGQLPPNCAYYCGAGASMDELRELLSAWRDAKRSARRALVAWAVRVLSAALLIGLAVKLRLTDLVLQ